MFLLIVQRIYLKSLRIKLAKVHLEGTGMGLPGIRHEDLNCWLVGGMPWAHVTYKSCWSILNHSTNLYSPPSVLCIPTYNVWGYSQSTLISIYAVSSPTFKDLRFLGSYLKAKRPLIYWVSQLVKRPERQTPAFLFGETWGIVLSVHYVGPYPLPDHLYYLWGFT